MKEARKGLGERLPAEERKRNPNLDGQERAFLKR